MTRRKLLAAAGLANCAKPRSRPPNVLFVIADDQSYPHAGAYGDKLAVTPAFDRIAAEGVLFTNSFSACPSCTPSRSAILTGRPIWSIEEAGVLYGTIPPKYALFPHALADLGYVCGFTGKGWGPGNWQAGGLTRHPIGTEFNSRRRPAVLRTGLDARDYAANFQDFLAARPRETPFFFWMGATEPHRVYHKGAGAALGKSAADVRVPAYWPDAGEIRSDILDYYAEIDWYDQQLQRALTVLEKTGEMDNTLIIVTSDNGMPFPRAKVNLYDSGVRMPLAMRWPARLPGGRASGRLVSHSGLAATILDAAGAGPAPGMWGRSLLDESTAEPFVFTGFERHTMCRPGGATFPMRAVRTARYHYIRNYAPDRWPTGGDFLSSNRTPHGDVDACPTKDFMTDSANRSRYNRQFELCFGRRPAEELYDVAADPDEVRNLAGAAEHAAAMAELRAALEARLRETGDPRLEGRDPWQDYVYHQTTGFGASFNRSLPEEVRRRAREAASHKPE